jgi:2-polyprenyl-6-methoxyphenol hydroxylase-like FAD-dependent oxidoreductase
MVLDMAQIKKPRDVDVLIVGAGPSGLMMACQLAFHEISFRIIDKNTHCTGYSGALVLQSRSVEILQQMGIAHAAIQKGIIADAITIVFNGKKACTIPVRNIGEGLTPFPYLLLLEQSATELLLLDYILQFGYAVERGTELQQFDQDTGGITSVIQDASENRQTIKTKYLVAADGGHSFVREQLHIPFLRKTHPVSLFVTDCKAEVDIPGDQICFSFSDTTTAGFFPLTGGRWRVDGAIPKEMDGQDTLTFNDMEKEFSERIQMRLKLSQPKWFSVFHSHQGYALSYQHNRCFLVGDAAHIHSPVGAQGMNTGLQDAYNLAWKLAMVIQNKAQPVLLSTYTLERTHIAKNVLRSTDVVFQLATNRNIFVRLFRTQVLPLLIQLLFPLIERQKTVRQFFFKKISEIGIHYRESSISKNSSFGNFPSHAPRPGDRLPYILYFENGATVNVQDKVKGPGFHLFILAKQNTPVDTLRIAEKHKSVLEIEIIPYTLETRDLYKQLGINNSGWYLIRPDLYIAYRSCVSKAEHFENYLRRFAGS